LLIPQIPEENDPELNCVFGFSLSFKYEGRIKTFLDVKGLKCVLRREWREVPEAGPESNQIRGRKRYPLWWVK
jgi:hypothetical protein